MDVSGIETIFSYHYGMFESVWGSVDQLPVDQFVEENDYSLGSVRNHLVHCMNVDDRWIARLQGATLPDILDEYTFPDQAATRAEWDATRERVLAVIGSYSDAELDEAIPLYFPDRSGEPKWNTRREIMLHMVNHGTDHRAQILARLHELGAPTLEQDLILHLWAQE